MNKDKPLSKARFWLLLLLLGFAGQLAWAVENQYINLWVFSQSHNAAHITWMTAASSIVATVTTFLIGALSDRLGKRRIFISLGYTIWGVFVFGFAIMSLSNMLTLSNGDMALALILVGVFNCIIDCLMTFFGSSANDACFNAWVTDNTDEHTRLLVESVLSVLPLIATALMVVLGGSLALGGNPAEGQSYADFAKEVQNLWLIFFLIVGVITSIVGIICFIFLPKDKIVPNRNGNYFKTLIHGFLPSSIKGNPDFYIALLAFLFFNIGVDAFMPYYLVYFTNTLALGNFYPAMAIILGVSSLVTVALGAFMDKIGKLKLLIPGVVMMASGALLLFFSGAVWWPAVLSATLMMSGYLIGTAVLGATVRDETKENEVGSAQGVRMVFAVLIPMLVGSNIALAVFTDRRVDETGSVLYPDRNMFIVTSIAAALSLIPSIFLILRKMRKKGQKEPIESVEEKSEE